MTFPMNQNLSLVIPRIFPHSVNEETIINVFHNQCIGRVYKVSIIRLPGNYQRKYPIYKAYVYFSVWYENEIAYNFQQRILLRSEARVVYNDPWYWVVFKNNKNRLSKNDQRFMRLENQLYHLNNYTEKLEDRISKLEETYFQQLEDTAIYAAESVLYDE